MLLAVDLGSSGVKAGLFQRDGRATLSDSVGVTVERSGLAAEVEPADWVVAVRTVVQAVLQGAAPPAAVVLTGQMGSWIFLDDSGEPTGRAITWMDGRLAAAQEEALRLTDPSAFYAASGQRVPNLPAVLTLARHQGRTGTPVMLREWLMLLLTGTLRYDLTDASTTGCLEVAGQEWWSGARVWSVPEAALPALAVPWEVVGRVTADGERRLGVPAGTPVVAGAGDGPCASLGAGAVYPGDACLTLGSSGTLRLLVDRPLLDPERRSTCLAFTPDLWVAMAATSNAGYALDWARRALGYKDFAELEAEAASVGPGARGLLFLPYLVGERFPLWEGRLRGGFYGLDPDHNRAHMARAVLEAIALTLHQAQRHFMALGAAPSSVVINGGGSRASLLTSLMAAALGVPCGIAPGSSLTGAAMLAAVALGLYPDLPAAVAGMAPPLYPVKPAVWTPDALESTRARLARLSDLLAAEVHAGRLQPLA